jgi:uncharacterized protein (DUF58 family)
MKPPLAASQGPDAGRADLLGPEQLALLGGLEFVAARVVDGFLLGLHRSPRRGLSAEFAELRAYRPGDDLRHLDWRMLGRSDRHFVKQFEEDTHLSAYVLLDSSSSMDWSSRPGTLPTKFWTAQVLAAALGLLLFRQGDRVGFAPFDARVRSWLPARGGRRHQSEFLRSVARQEPQGETEAGEPLQEVAIRMRRPGLVVLISDLLLDPEPTTRALRLLSHRGHHVQVLHLMDPGERSLGGMGPRRLRDPESGIELRVATAEVRAGYDRGVEAALRRWRSALRPARIAYEVVDTQAPLGSTLHRVLRTRARR